MMRLITEYDLKMSKELDKWEEYPDGECHLREDAPEDVVYEEARLKTIHAKERRQYRLHSPQTTKRPKQNTRTLQNK